MTLSVTCRIPRELALNPGTDGKETLILEMSDGSHFEIEHVAEPDRPDLYNGAWMQPSKYGNSPDEVCEALSTHDKKELEDWLSDVMSRIPCHLVDAR